MSALQMQTAPIGELVDKVVSWNPLRDAPNHELAYIDLSAVDNLIKAVTGCQSILGCDAPSRARQRVRAGDVLVSTVRPNLNGVARVPLHLDGATASTGFCVLRPKPAKLDASYLFHWVQSPNFVDDMVRKATGASYPAISDKIIARSEIPLPTLAEQKRIAAILDQADELRRKRQRAITQLGGMGQAIFYEMFGDPVANERGWPSEQLNDVCRNITDGTHDTPERTETGVPFITSKNVRPFEFDLSNLEYVSEETHKDIIKRCNPKLGDILYTNIGASVGAAVKNYLDFEFSLKNVALIQPDTDIIKSDYLEYALNNQNFKAALLSVSAAGGAQKFVTLKALRSTAIPLPPIEAQASFQERISALRACAKLLKTQSRHFESLFAALQHRAFRGKL